MFSEGFSSFLIINLIEPDAKKLAGSGLPPTQAAPPPSSGRGLQGGPPSGGPGGMGGPNMGGPPMGGPGMGGPPGMGGGPQINEDIKVPDKMVGLSE